MRALSVITLLAVLILPTVAFAEIQTFTATHTYILGDHDSKDDARQRCLLEAKRKILEQAGVYIESASEVKNFDLTKDKITSFAAAVMQIKDTKEAVGFENGHMTLTLKVTAQVDLAEVHKQLAARQVDASVRDTVATQQERLKHLEVQLEAMMQRQQGGQSSGQAPTSPPIDISAEDLRTLRAQGAQGNATAQAKLGLLYDFGWGVPQDYVQARAWYEKAAAQGYEWGQVRLGMLYDNGRGARQDSVQARQWYQKAAAQGNMLAQSQLGLLYAEGRGVPKDDVQAWAWYEKAAAQGFEWGQFSLGGLYEAGRGVPQDYAQAAKWYEKAAAQGNVGGQAGLGYLYHVGRGVPQDYVQARQWYQKAAAQGHALAQYALGTLYESGNGIPQDYVRAYMWTYLAAANSTGDIQESAGDSRDRVARRMTPAQVAEAKNLAIRCQAQHFKGC